MKSNPLVALIVLVVIITAYFIGEATGLLFVAMLIILPAWVWLLGLLDVKDQNH
jgi:hypothetical protein